MCDAYAWCVQVRTQSKCACASKRAEHVCLRAQARARKETTWMATATCLYTYHMPASTHTCQHTCLPVHMPASAPARSVQSDLYMAKETCKH
jgi:hypothetical protein